MAKKLAKSAVSQKRVLDAAARIFRDFGYTGTTMRVIAQAADLKAGSIYYHYRSKDELISAVLDIAIHALMNNVVKALQDIPENASGRERIEAAIAAHLRAIIEVGDYALATRRALGQVPEAIRARNTRMREQYGLMWQKILTDAHESGEFRTSANLKLARLFILGALNWTVEWFKPGGRSIEDVAREFASIILDGLSGHHTLFADAIESPVKTRRSAPRVRVI